MNVQAINPAKRSAGEPPFELDLRPDSRHPVDDLFHNPHGVWFLRRATSSAPAPNKWKKPEDEPLFILIPKNDEKMLAAYATARKTLPTFLTAIASKRFSDATNSAKIKLKIGEAEGERDNDNATYLWLWDVQQLDDQMLQATVRELPKDGLSGLKIGEALQFAHEEVHDWMIVQGSQAWGGFTLRVVRDRMNPQERLQYDEYTGILCYNELP